MCECTDKQQKKRSQREAIQSLFARNAKAAFNHRLSICCHATDCGRLCPRLVKGPGIAIVKCVDVQTGQQADLYEALAKAEFACPLDLF